MMMYRRSRAPKAPNFFYWWDDAVAYATERATRTGLRHSVLAERGMWLVREVGA